MSFGSFAVMTAGQGVKSCTLPIRGSMAFPLAMNSLYKNRRPSPTVTFKTKIALPTNLIPPVLLVGSKLSGHVKYLTDGSNNPCSSKASPSTMSSIPSSTGANDGSAGSIPSSNSSLPNHNNMQSSSLSSPTTCKKRDLAVYRINEYVTSPEHPHVQHRHASSQQAIRTHTNTMGSYLAAFDDTMSQGGN